jgi:ABC-type transport system involved in multi-copper enzyme maturation permease subunit
MIMKRLVRDNIMRITAVLSVLLGIFIGRESTCCGSVYVQDFYFYIGQIFMSALLCFSLGRIYHDGTVRNILIAGYTRAKLYFASLLAALTVGCIYLLLTAGIFALYLIPYYAGFDEKALIEAFISIALSGLFCALAASVCCHLRRSQLGGILACFALIFGLYFLGECTGQADRSDDGWYEEWMTDADGRVLFDENGEPIIVRQQRFYMQEPLHSAVMFIHRANPLIGMDELSNVLYYNPQWSDADYEEVKDRAVSSMEMRFAVTVPVMILLPLGGLLLYRRRDIR